jgi:hypothetical protein
MKRKGQAPWSRLGAGLLLLIAGLPAWAEMEVIALKYRTAEQVLPVLRPLMESCGALSGVNNQLVIRASRANIAELRKVINSVDVAPRRFMISVRQDAGGAGNSGEPGGTASAARVYDSRSARETRMEQRIQAMEGTPAFIQIGSSVPVTNRVVTQGPGGAVVTDSIAYRDATAGFEVVPRVAGDRVMLDISPRRDAIAAGGAIGVQRMASTASGRLGEWFELGGASQDESRQAGGMVAGTSALRQDVRRVWVRVEEIK